MKKVIHIHSDNKFISDTKRFDGQLFKNKIIILGSKNLYNKNYHDTAYFFESNSSSLIQILQIVNEADFLVIYNLDIFKSLIVNGANPNLIIIWRFFGQELYKRKLHFYLSKKSKSFFKPDIFKGRIKSNFTIFFNMEKLFYSALKRINLMACIFEEEYKYLLSLWPNLPEYIQFPMATIDESNNFDFQKDWPKEKLLVLGNSRSYYNNHMDILDKIENSNVHEKLQIKLLFNYGAENKYTAEVRNKVLELKSVEIIDTFILKNDFRDFYNPVAAIVNNGYRQFALGNIILGLQKGVKVYLNKKNSIYNWLNKEGFYIYEIDDLKKDLETGQISLLKSEIEHNIKCLKKLRETQSNTNFQIQILQLLNK